MRGILLQLFILAAAQLSAPTLRTGEVATSLSADDIAELVNMMGGVRPWLVRGVNPIGPPTTVQTITAYFAPTRVTSTLRRGPYFVFSRETKPVPEPWRGQGSARPYLQVAIPGRPFEEILSDQDLNQPFMVTGESFEDDELVELVTFIRTNPLVIAEGRGNGPPGVRVGLFPISSVNRLADTLVRVEFLVDVGQTRTAIVQKRGANWVVTSLRTGLIRV